MTVAYPGNTNNFDGEIQIPADGADVLQASSVNQGLQQLADNCATLNENSPSLYSAYATTTATDDSGLRLTSKFTGTLYAETNDAANGDYIEVSKAGWYLVRLGVAIASTDNANPETLRAFVSGTSGGGATVGLGYRYSTDTTRFTFVTFEEALEITDTGTQFFRPGVSADNGTASIDSGIPFPNNFFTIEKL